MLAVRKLTKSSLGKWQQAIADDVSFEDLPFGLVREWVTEDGAVSIYVIDDETQLPSVSMALTMLTGEGPKGGAFLVIPLDQLAELDVKKTPGATLSKAVDDRHYDVRLRKGGDLRLLVEAFLSGDIRSASQEDALTCAVGAFDQGDYSVVDLAQKLKPKQTDSQPQRVCSSAMKLVAGKHLSLPAQAIP